MKLLSDAFATVLFASVFDNCGNQWSKNAQPMQPLPGTPVLPCCLTDPPAGCRAVCAAAGDVEMSAECNGIGAGPREAQFDALVQTYVLQLVMQGTQVCTTDPMGGVMGDLMVGDSVTPCNLGIPPIEWPNQDHEVCAPMPAGVCVTSW